MMGMDQDGLLFPKPGKKKPKKKAHPKSIMHNKEDRTCYICMIVHDDYRKYDELEEHHVFFGTGKRKLSEEYGLKVYLCREHHTTAGGPDAVHNNAWVNHLIQNDGQRRFEEEYPDQDFMKIFGKNYKMEETCKKENATVF